MKLLNRNTLLAWTVLICFITGQYIVFAHQHNGGINSAVNINLKKAAPLQTVTEKCYLCDMMNHTQMDISYQATPFKPVSFDIPAYNRQHDYKGIALILSAGRSPPCNI